MQNSKKEIAYITACIFEFARFTNLTLQESFNYLYRYKAIDFLKEHYEAEHLLSFDEVIEDLILVCKNNGGEYDFISR